MRFISSSPTGLCGKQLVLLAYSHFEMIVARIHRILDDTSPAVPLHDQDGKEAQEKEYSLTLYADALTATNLAPRNTKAKAS